ncbi:hypothetical protein ASG56_05895 [Rhodococcus sp. Leaf7]|uniref:TetR/AcrR family transcriptional regulator n=1 Tax=unclassified Rhodococcus (in: high G+C Gram-positive bacteria) TaxID=192944 RepID=UPI0006F66ADE|nr:MULTISPECIES: ABC-F family ATP-binding cassette domain-containing protein [unclassified Rhodococcus (in: high G+C Gram-positive bacteria)]KQU07083.1 hypothetical protein ASG56_05895 [Rhodococcus sp. Leaf7]KQU42601.1 hypothetical protein ASG64_05895 [Rhodococcus sp. Leaf247]
METARAKAASRRRRDIADAVIALLAAKGSRSVTHRAVDQHLDLAEGSTSAYFRTRVSLLTAAAQRLAQRDRSAVDALTADLGENARTSTFAELLAAIVDEWTTVDAAPRQLARLELQLEARSLPDLADAFAELRAAFVDSARLLIALRQPELDDHSATALAGVIVAMVDGLVVDRLLHPATAVSTQALPAAIASLAASNW